MVEIEKIAGHIYKLYEERFHQKIDEMKLHKLLYFLQREHYVVNRTPLFSEKFNAYQFGPVSLKVRDSYKSGNIAKDNLSEEMIYQLHDLIEQVFTKYAGKSSWTLSSITHGEQSWIRAIKRSKINGEPSIMLDEDIKEDAIRIKLRRMLSIN